LQERRRGGGVQLFGYCWICSQVFKKWWRVASGTVNTANAIGNQNGHTHGGVRVPFRLDNSKGCQSTPFLDGEEQQEGEFALHRPWRKALRQPPPAHFLLSPAHLLPQNPAMIN
jgi:hypothetical protein